MTYAEEMDPVLTVPTHRILVSYQIWEDQQRGATPPLELKIPAGWTQKYQSWDQVTRKAMWEIEGNLLTISSAIGTLTYELATLSQAKTIYQTFEIRITQIPNAERAAEEAAAAPAAAAEPPSWWAWALGL